MMPFNQINWDFELVISFTKNLLLCIHCYKLCCIVLFQTICLPALPCFRPYAIKDTFFLMVLCRMLIYLFFKLLWRLKFLVFQINILVSGLMHQYMVFSKDVYNKKFLKRFSVVLCKTLGSAKNHFSLYTLKIKVLYMHQWYYKEPLLLNTVIVESVSLGY